MLDYIHDHHYLHHLGLRDVRPHLHPGALLGMCDVRPHIHHRGCHPGALLGMHDVRPHLHHCGGALV